MAAVQAQQADAQDRPDEEASASAAAPSKEALGELFKDHAHAFYECLEAVNKQSVSARAEAAAPRGGAGESFVERKRSRIQRLQELATRCLVSEAKEEQRELQRQLAEDDVEIGRVVTQALGGEVWYDGQRPRRHREKLAGIEKQRLDARALGKELRKQLAELEAAEADPASDAAQRVRIQLDVNRRQQDMYKRQEADVREQLAEHAAQKALHVKEHRRLRDQERSPFSKFPVLDHGRYLVLSLLGKGGFSEVWRAIDLETSETVAMKLHQTNPTWSAEKRAQYVRHAKREFEIQQQARHPRVVGLVDCFDLPQCKDSFCTVLEHTKYGDLDSYLKKFKELPEGTARPLMAQILSGLAYLHSKKIIHYDLKPANVLFFSPSEVKLTDFGLSKSMAGRSAEAQGEDTNIELTSQGAGTYWYLPPECFETRFTPKVTAKVDIWAAGCVFYQMLFKRRPFGHDVSQRDLFHQGIIINAREVTFPTKPKISDGGRNVITHCLSYDPAHRPAAADLLADPYFYQASVGPGAKKMQQATAAAVRRCRPESEAEDPPSKRAKRVL
eukprot:TRINITY_DN18503_c0_g1_i1.p1 TRINITY_DN18503_c0_g1~~TRINITY_DN18503_c0_g1_i1.p1  ORF type:complete len:558 (+),score=219.32 TRINITY_DN18503_c0_g1_i1:66-1739(+)